MPFRKYRQANCSVVILNAEDDVLDTLLELFYAEALLQKRRAVAAIDMQSIKLAIMSETSDPAGLAARNAVLSGHPLPNATVAMFIKRRIDEYVLENDRILDILSTNQKVTLLDYWIANDSPSMDDSLPAAVGKIKKMKEKETANAVGKKAGKMKNVKFKLPTYVKKSRSTIVQRGQIATHKTFIEDSPIDGPNLFIVCLGIYSLEVLTELIRLDVPVNAVIRLKSCNHDDQVHGSYSTFWDELDQSKPYNRLKNIAVIEISLTRLHTDDCLRKHIETISTEIAYLLYDTNEKVQQHRQYLNDMKVYEVAVQKSEVCITDFSVYCNYFVNMSEEKIGVEHILEAMVSQASDLNDDDPEEISSITRNFNHEPLCILFEDKVIVVETQDKLSIDLSAIAEPHLERYQFRLQALYKAWNLHRFKDQHDIEACEFPEQSVEFVLNTLASLDISPDFPVETSMETIIQRVLQLIPQSKIDHYVELFCAGALQQKLVECLQLCDNVEQIYVSITNSMLVRLSTSLMNDGIFRNSSMFSLSTPICLRDYVDYNVNRETENRKSIYTFIETTNSCVDNSVNVTNTSCLPCISSTIFLVNRSMKKHGNDPFEPTVEDKLIVVDSASFKERNGKKDKAQTPLPGSEQTSPRNEQLVKKKPNKNKKASNFPAVSPPAIPETDIPTYLHSGYDIGDRRCQLNRQLVVFRSVAMTIRYMCDHWLFGAKHIWLRATTEHGADIIFGQANDSEAIDHVLVRQLDGVHVVLEVVDERSMRLHIGRPNGLLVQTVMLNQSQNRVDQMWTATPLSPNGEQRRSIFSNGWVAIYYTSGNIRLITSNGMVVETGDEEKFAEHYSADKNRLSIKKRKSSAEKTIEFKSFGHEYVLTEILAVMPELAEKTCKMTTSDGSVYVVKSGTIDHHLKSLWSTEIYDYQRNECLLRREDGFKINVAHDSTRCIYSDGTQIWSSMSCRDLCVSDDDDGVCFTVVSRTFRIQHDAYEEVVFDATDSTDANVAKLHFPMRNVCFTPTKITAKLGDTVSLDCDANDFRLTIEHCQLHHKQSLMRIWFGAGKTHPMMQFEGMTVDRMDGVSIVKTENRSTCARCDANNPSDMRPRNFIVKRDWSGYEILPASLVQQAIADAEITAGIIDRDDGFISILDVMPVERDTKNDETDTFLSNAYNTKLCKPVLDHEKLPKKIGIRMFGRVKCAVSESIEPPGTNASVFCKAAEKALISFLKKEESIYMARTTRKPMSARWTEKMRLLHLELQRSELYKKLLRSGYIPSYTEFRQADWMARNLDVDHMNITMHAVRGN